jgi:hypothetical protein
MRSGAGSPTRTPYNAEPRAAIAPRPAADAHKWGRRISAQVGLWRPGGSAYILNSRLALPLKILVLSSSHSGTVSIHCTAGLLATKIDRKQDTVDAHLHHAAQQRRIGEVAAGRDVELAAEVKPKH